MAALSVAQQPPQQPANPGAGTAPAPAPNVPSTPDRGNTRMPTPQNDPRQQRQQFPEMQRPIFLSGKVVLEDGTPPPELVTIERVCNGQPRPEGYTDSKGRFQIQLGQNTHLLADASVGSSNDVFSSGGPGGNSMGFPGQGRGISERDLIGCELRASLAGYRSEAVMLSGRRMLDNPDVGTIILRRLGNVEGFTYSATSMMAPKDAKKSFERGTDRLKKKKFDEAQKEYEKAVELYPKYAAAWYELGVLHQSQKRPEEARKAYEQALAADSKFVNPYRRMAELYAGEQKWQEVADTTARVIRLNPVDFPDAYFYNSVANYNLQKFEAAEKSAAEAVKLDTNHRMPKAQHLLGVLQAMRNELTGAAENIRGYLKYAPQATDAANVRKQLTEIERQLGQTEAAKQQQ
jgi:tetratricopeptide (TPR) repeat protein